MQLKERRNTQLRWNSSPTYINVVKWDCTFCETLVNGLHDGNAQPLVSTWHDNGQKRNLYQDLNNVGLQWLPWHLGTHLVTSDTYHEHKNPANDDTLRMTTLYYGYCQCLVFVVIAW